MGISIDSSLDFEDLFWEEDLITPLPSWYGREITREDLPELQSHLVRKIIELALEDEALLYKLAWLGASTEKQPLIDKEIVEFIQFQDEWEVNECGFKSFRKSCNSLWKSTCKKTKKLWKDNKKEIIIGTVVAATAVAVAVVSIYTDDTCTQLATAAGGALVNSLIDSAYGTVSVNEIPIGSIPIPAPRPRERFYAPPVDDVPLYLGSEAPSSPSSQIISPLTQFLYPDAYAFYEERQVQQLYEKFGLNYTHLNTIPVEISEAPPHLVSQPSEIQKFRELLENKLGEPHSATYVEQFPKSPRGNIDFVEHLEKNYLVQFEDPYYFTTLKTVQEMYKATEGFFGNYASELSSSKPDAPFFDVPFLGDAKQGTVHFHCGIQNNFTSVVHAGLTLKDSLDQAYAIQPHLLHTNNIITGLSMVGLEKFDSWLETHLPAGVSSMAGFPGSFLQHSHIERSIDYVVENLSQIAQNILEKDNPNLKQVHVTFSNGGYVMKEALKRLPPEHRETIILITTGTTAIIDKDQACKVVNFIGDKDWPSQLCNGGMAGIEATRERAKVIIIPQKEIKSLVSGHYSEQPDYQDQISTILEKEVENEFEIY